MSRYNETKDTSDAELLTARALVSDAEASVSLLGTYEAMLANAKDDNERNKATAAIRMLGKLGMP